jgi:hypothetical protein
MSVCVCVCVCVCVYKCAQGHVYEFVCVYVCVCVYKYAQGHSEMEEERHCRMAMGVW